MQARRCKRTRANNAGGNMASLLLNNVDTEASDDEIKQFLVKYGFPEYDSIEHMPGDGSRPAVLLGFADATAESLRILQPRVQNLFWHDRKIQLQIMERID
jgi:hypothetical protein